MLAVIRLGLLLAAAFTLVSSKPLHSTTIYSNCSGTGYVPLPVGAAATPYFKPQLHVDPRDINKNGTGWEEWAFIHHNRLPDGSELLYSYKWSMGDPTSGNVSHQVFVGWAYFPNGTFYHEVVRDKFLYEEYKDGGFKFSIADNHLVWDPATDRWNVSVNVNGWIINSSTENFEPSIPYAPNYQSKVGQISKDFYSRIEVPRGHTDGEMTFPWGLTVTVQSVGTLKHTWSYKVMADAISSYVRGSTFLPNILPVPIATMNWYQAWDPSGKEVDSMQFLVQSDPATENQAFRIQITDAPKVLSIVTTPKPESIDLSYTSTEITLPMCGPGADPKKEEKMVWTAHNALDIYKFIDFAGGVTIYQKVNMTGVVWFDGVAQPFAGGIGVVEIYHRQ